MTTLPYGFWWLVNLKAMDVLSTATILLALGGYEKNMLLPFEPRMVLIIGGILNLMVLIVILAAWKTAGVVRVDESERRLARRVLNGSVGLLVLVNYAVVLWNLGVIGQSILS